MQTKQHSLNEALSPTLVLDQTLFRIRRDYSPYRMVNAAFSSYLQSVLKQSGRCQPDTRGREP